MPFTDTHWSASLSAVVRPRCGHRSPSRRYLITLASQCSARCLCLHVPGVPFLGAAARARKCAFAVDKYSIARSRYVVDILSRTLSTKESVSPILCSLAAEWPQRWQEEVGFPRLRSEVSIARSCEKDVARSAASRSSRRQ